MRILRRKRTTGLRRACKSARGVTLTRRTIMWKKRFTGWKRTGKQTVEFAACIEHRGAVRHGVFFGGGEWSARVAPAGAWKAGAVKPNKLDCDKVCAFPCFARNGASMRCDVCGLEYGL